MTKKTFKRKLNPNQEQTKLYDKITFLQTKIISKIHTLKKSKNALTICSHINKKPDSLDYDQTANYYQKFWQEYMMCMAHFKRMKQFENSVEKLQCNLGELEEKFNLRQEILNLPAFQKIKRPLSKYFKSNNDSKKQLQQAENIDQQKNVTLKKQEDVQPQFINFQQSDNPIFYE